MKNLKYLIELMREPAEFDYNQVIITKATITDIMGEGLGGKFLILDKVKIGPIQCYACVDYDGVGERTYLIPTFEVDDDNNAYIDRAYKHKNKEA